MENEVIISTTPTSSIIKPGSTRVTEVIDLGYFDHLAQILHIKVKNPKIRRRKIKKKDSF
jgi:hypothetical protein